MDTYKKFSDITVVIPAYNEEQSIGKVISDLQEYFSNILVVDDNSKDNTATLASQSGARVVKNEFEKGYLGAIKTGYRKATTEWIANIDADGEHRVSDLVNLFKFTKKSDYDLVIGKRPFNQISRPSEVLLSLIAYIKSPVFDTGSGMKVIKTDIAKQMQLIGKCICGTYVLEALNLGAKIGEYPIKLNCVGKPRGIAWYHFEQFFVLLILLIKGKKYYERKYT